MVRKRRTPNPIPPTWARRKTSALQDEPDIRDLVLDGDCPKPGTIRHLRIALAAAGWSQEALQPKRLELTRSNLYDPSKPSKADVGTTVTALRKAGYVVDVADQSYVSLLWRSITNHPWWFAAAGGQRLVTLLAKDDSKAQLASSLFIHDVWSTLGERPVQRMPIFRRVSLTSLMSGDGSARFLETRGAETDILVLTGGLLEEETLYLTFAHLAAILSAFRGFIVYEAVPAADCALEQVISTAKRSGAPLLIGVD